MSARQQRAEGRERGAAAVELALLTPLLVALLVGAVELTFMFHRSQDLEAAAREGARYASDDEGRTKEEIVTRTTNALSESGGVTITVDPDLDQPCEGREGDPVRVSVSVAEDLDLLFVSTVSIDLGGSAEFICSNNQAPLVIATPTP